MQRSRAEVVKSLEALVESWKGYTGTEKAGAQTFINQLVQAYTGEADPRKLDASHEAHLPLDEGNKHGFIDFFWPGVVLIEMKGPKESVRLAEHRPQMLRYWKYCATEEFPAPQFTILCSFDRFEVWEPGRYPNAPRDVFSLAELPDFVDSLAFLMGQGKTPSYGGPGQKITIEASKNMIDLFDRLGRRFIGKDEYDLTEDQLRRFVVQCTWTLFAEDLALIPPKRFANLLKSLDDDAHGAKMRIPGREIQSFLGAMNSKNAMDRSEGFLAGLPYVNGGLLEDVPYIPLTAMDVRDLHNASRFDWRYVNPTIFGSLFEGCLGDRRRQFGAHYTHEQDIMQIVEPTILKPWRDRIAATTKYKDLEALLRELCDFKVLDPACGSGNFLYVAYREIRRLEHYLKDRIDEATQAAGKHPRMHLDFYPIDNLHGIEIEPFAVQIARLTIWMGHAQMSRELNVQGDDPLPLHDLSTIIEADALKSDWPAVDAIIGNPPFIGSQHIRKSNGDDYIDFLKTEFKAGVVDLCAYWFRKANDSMQDGHRAGLVATNSVSQNKARGASLDYIIANGAVITDAVSSQVWPGDAAVHVSIVNWVKSPSLPPSGRLLDKMPVEEISSSLKVGNANPTASKLAPNSGLSFQGCIPVGKGFLLEDSEAQALLALTDANYADVVLPHLGSNDIADSPDLVPSGWIIDFGLLDLDDAMAYPAALEIIRQRVKPIRDENRRKTTREKWWRHGEARPAMRTALAPLSRFISVGRHGKRLLFIWGDKAWCPSDATNVIARDDDWTFGVLASFAHKAWAWEQSSTLKSDIRYTPSTTFETFPFPNRTTSTSAAIEMAVASVVLERSNASAKLVSQGKKQAGLTAVYNAMDEGAFAALRLAHQRLDEAVCKAYGWSVSVLDDNEEVMNQLYDLNASLSADSSNYNPFANES
ncbi:hypothetical protein DQ353_17115 [Arthrobacter sp. AQ5-05]|nr:hypothetical protein DQ353_17115 [Arthrobacter sp. AQ5-05]